MNVILKSHLSTSSSGSPILDLFGKEVIIPTYKRVNDVLDLNYDDNDTGVVCPNCGENYDIEEGCISCGAGNSELGDDAYYRTFFEEPKIKKPPNIYFSFGEIGAFNLSKDKNGIIKFFEVMYLGETYRITISPYILDKLKNFKIERISILKRKTFEKIFLKSFDFDILRNFTLKLLNFHHFEK